MNLRDLFACLLAVVEAVDEGNISRARLALDGLRVQSSSTIPNEDYDWRRAYELAYGPFR